MKRLVTGSLLFSTLVLALASATPRCGAAGPPEFEKFGIGATLVHSDSTRVVIKDCMAGSPAERGGLIPGDRILELDGSSIDGWTFGEVLAYLRRDTPAPVTVSVQRGADKLSFQLLRARLSDIAEGAGIRYVLDSDSTTYIPVSLEEVKPLTVGDRLDASGLRTMECEPGGWSPNGAQPTLVYVWAGWCGSCKAVLAGLKASRASGEPGQLRMVGINVDESCDAFVAACAKVSPAGEQYWGGGWVGRLPQSLDISHRGIPTAALIDTDGTILAVASGLEGIRGLASGKIGP